MRPEISPPPPCATCGDPIPYRPKMGARWSTRRFCSDACARGRTLQPIEDRFWSKVDKGNGTGCWVWTRTREAYGYGRFGLKDGTIAKAHRFAWELANGPIPDGMWVLHRCDNPPCVRPDHLYLGTQTENMHDASVRRRFPSGGDHWTRREPERWLAQMRLNERCRWRRPDGTFGCGYIRAHTGEHSSVA